MGIELNMGLWNTVQLGHCTGSSSPSVARISEKCCELTHWTAGQSLRYK